jgi:hypothetical protein
MIVYTAEKADGDIYYIAARPSLNAEGFATELLAYLRVMPDDERTPQQLSLYRWRDESEAGYWLRGIAESWPTFGSWPEMAKQASIGEIRYEYAGMGQGEWFYRQAVSA